MGNGVETMTTLTDLDTPVFPLKTKLGDGTRILIRPLQLEDAADLVRGFAKLSMSSRRYRFLTPIRKLSKYQLSSLVEVDQQNHVAIGVKDIGRPGKPGIAVGRFVRMDENANTAEFAITVIDEYQSRGIGTLLLEILFRAARERGITVLRGYLLDDNRIMIRLLERFGAHIKRDSGNVLLADLPVNHPT
jgi:RimJ/RimL family protein N-acetyltransferase